MSESSIERFHGARDESAGYESGVERFDADGRWKDPPAPWDDPSLADDGVIAAVEEAISSLPSGERAVLTLRDVEGLGADEACAVLDLSMSRQRALLHRGRGIALD